ncbi:DNA-binding protein [Methanocalculus chunghsingensis]|uniref:DNA-binding protein n=1 Tax=Methanocalculus chunghsingensis TaxID=156457 RepID=A0A8J7WAZ1_9EURY|nr:PPC domain-containing DNA-binding protein [Methanocalculus chunghsingensis]MBR1369590.1 DNA-binding protein [Methanocalculus chunghsingensis]
MQYAEGRIGRVFFIRIDDGEELITTLTGFARDHGISHGTITFFGALKRAGLVTGPEEAVIPPVPHHEEIEGGWECLGTATIYPGEDGPSLHLHATAGRGRDAITGCLRTDCRVYLVVEAVLYEAVGIDGSRLPDPVIGAALPVLRHQNP